MKEPSDLRRTSRVMVLGVLLCAGGAAHAESLRCNGTSVGEGDSKLGLIRACGQPTVSDSYCARVVQPVLVPYGVSPVPQVTCVMTDEWLYDRGPGNLDAVVRMREGKIISIRYGEEGRSRD